MKYLAENGLLPEGDSVRMIVGCDEEELQCIEYYKQRALYAGRILRPRRLLSSDELRKRYHRLRSGLPHHR